MSDKAKTSFIDSTESAEVLAAAVAEGLEDCDLDAVLAGHCKPSASRIINLEADHSPVGPSGAARWLVCAGSVERSIGVIDVPTDAALSGRKTHKLSEMILRPAVAAREREGRDKFLESDLERALDFRR